VTRPPGVSGEEQAPEANWIQTVEGRDFLAVLRLYGAQIEFCDQSWKPGDVVKFD
jgi:hypothetical protein